MRCLSLLCDLASHPGRLNIARTIFLLTAPEIIKKTCNLHFCYGGFFTLPNTVYPRWVLRVVTHLSFHYVIEQKKCHISMQILCNVLYFWNAHLLILLTITWIFRRNTDNSNSRPLSRLYHRRIPQTWEPCVWYNTRGRQYFICGHREQNIHHPWVCRRTRWTERISSRPAQCRHRWQGLSSAGYSSPCGKRESWIGRCWWELEQKIVVC